MWTERSHVGSGGWLPTSRYGYTDSHQLGLGASPLAMVAPDTDILELLPQHSRDTFLRCRTKVSKHEDRSEPRVEPELAALGEAKPVAIRSLACRFSESKSAQIWYHCEPVQRGGLSLFYKIDQGNPLANGSDYGCSEDRSVLANGGASPSSCAFHQS